MFFSSSFDSLFFLFWSSIFVQGLVFSPVPFEVDLYPSDSEQIREQQQVTSEDARRGGFAGFKADIFELLIRFFSPNSVGLWFFFSSFYE